jgi:hypothetical protein
MGERRGEKREGKRERERGRERVRERRKEKGKQRKKHEQVETWGREGKENVVKVEMREEEREGGGETVRQALGPCLSWARTP